MVVDEFIEQEVVLGVEFKVYNMVVLILVMVFFMFIMLVYIGWVGVVQDVFDGFMDYLLLVIGKGFGLIVVLIVVIGVIFVSMVFYKV